MLTSLLLLIVVAVAYWLGWKHRDNWDWLRALWLKKVHPNVLEDTEQPRSSIVEPKPETPMQKAQREQEELLERLNP